MDELSAGEAAGTEMLTVRPGEDLEAAARTMVEHEITHLVVVEQGKPIGVVSSLDIAAAVSG